MFSIILIDTTKYTAYLVVDTIFQFAYLFAKIGSPQAFFAIYILLSIFFVTSKVYIKIRQYNVNGKSNVYVGISCLLCFSILQNFTKSRYRFTFHYFAIFS